MLRIAAIIVLSLLAVDASESDVVPLGVPGRSNSAPWVAAGGSFVAVSWGATANGKSDVFLAVSRDGGLTFGAPVQVNRDAGEVRISGEMPPRVALSVRSDRSDPEITVLWTTRTKVTEIKTSQSRDGGKTFSTPVALQKSGAPGDRGWPALAVDAGGEAHAVWLDHRGIPPPKPGVSHVHNPNAAHDGAAMAQRSSLYYAGLGNGGPREHEITKGVCYCCKTALAAGPHRTLAAAWRHVYPGNFRDIAFVMSRDGGRSFTAPVRVNEDGWAINGCPDDGPAIGVDAQGTAHIVWPSVIDGPQPEGEIFYASTRDGRTFSKRVRVPTLGSPKPAHPQVMIRDAGRLVVAWDEYLDGRRIATARELKLQDGQSPAFGEAVRLGPADAALYPVLAAASHGVIAVWTTGGESSRVMAKVIELR
jgi:hypothetical protein